MFKNLRESDRVGIFLLIFGVSVTCFSTLLGIGLVAHPFMKELPESVVDRGLSLLKDFFGIGGGLLTAAYTILRLQPKQTEGGAQLPPAGTAQ